MIRLYLTILLALGACNLFAQNINPDQIPINEIQLDTVDCEFTDFCNDEPRIDYYEKNTDNSVYSGMHKILWGNHPISYVLLLPHYFGIDRAVPLGDGEGQNQYLIEGNIDLTYPILQGRNQSRHWNQSNKLSFHYNPALRMTRDSSSPIYPTNQKVGLKWEYIFSNNYTKKDILKNDPFFYASRDNWKSTSGSFKMWNLELNVMHYSNGQPPGSNITDSLTGITRNDYRNGDFSTNYVQALFIRSILNQDHLFSFGIGAQLDGGIGDTFAYTEDQEGAYGHWRLNGFVQYRSTPHAYGKAILWSDFRNQKIYKVKKLIEHRFRLNYNFILDDLSNYNKSQEYRVSAHFIYQLNFIKARSAGLVFHFYTGRDYFNIRYDDVIYGFGFGCSFNLMKYRPPRLTVCDMVYNRNFVKFKKFNFRKK